MSGILNKRLAILKHVYYLNRSSIIIKRSNHMRTISNDINELAIQMNDLTKSNDTTAALQLLKDYTTNNKYVNKRNINLLHALDNLFLSSNANQYPLLEYLISNNLASHSQFILVWKNLLFVQKNYKDALALWIKYLQSQSTEYRYIHIAHGYTTLAYILQMSNNIESMNLKFITDYLQLKNDQPINWFSLSKLIDDNKDDIQDIISVKHALNALFLQSTNDVPNFISSLNNNKNMSITHLNLMVDWYCQSIIDHDWDPTVLSTFFKLYNDKSSYTRIIKLFGTIRNKNIDLINDDMRNELMIAVSNSNDPNDPKTKLKILAVWNEIIINKNLSNSYLSLFISFFNARCYDEIVKIYENELPDNIKNDPLVKDLFHSYSIISKSLIPNEITYNSRSKRNYYYYLPNDIILNILENDSIISNVNDQIGQCLLYNILKTAQKGNNVINLFNDTLTKMEKSEKFNSNSQNLQIIKFLSTLLKPVPEKISKYLLGLTPTQLSLLCFGWKKYNTKDQYLSQLDSLFHLCLNHNLENNKKIPVFLNEMYNWYLTDVASYLIATLRNNNKSNKINSSRYEARNNYLYDKLFDYFKLKEKYTDLRLNNKTFSTILDLLSSQNESISDNIKLGEFTISFISYMKIKKFRPNSTLWSKLKENINPTVKMPTNSSQPTSATPIVNSIETK